MPLRRKPIFRKVSNLLKVSILRRPIVLKLDFLKKSRKLKKFKLLKRYNNGFLEEDHFSSSSTQLARRHRKRKLIEKTSVKRIYSVLFLSRCLGRRLGDEGMVDGNRMLVKVPPSGLNLDVACPVGELMEPFDYVTDDDSIDQRAERFIEKFYHEMRLQRWESV